MEAFETNYKSNQSQKSTVIRELANTESNLAKLGAALDALHCRKKLVQAELKAPGLSADKERLHALLTELDRIARTLYGVRSGDGL
jgi:hypothetical protein